MSGYVRFTGAFAVMAALASLPPQTAGAQATPAGGGEVPAAGEKAGAVSTKSSRVEPPLTERERELLAHVRDLEKRLSALESRLASAGPQTAQPSSTPGAVAEVAPGPGSAAQEGPLAATARHDAAAAKARPQAEDTQLPPAAPEPAAEAAAEPFAFADFTWLNGNPRTTDSPMSTKVFTGEFRLDTSYIYDLNHPQDDTLVGSSESGRTGEFQVQQLGIGGDFHYDNVRGRLMTQFGMYSTMTPRNDASPTRGQWSLDNAYRYVSEAYGGYHIDKWNGINVDAGIFMSYVGLFSYYNFDNWAYQPSYVSSNTPWFFNGVRVQIFPSDKLKIEPWLINGWQSYGRFNSKPGLGLQVLWRPNGSISILSNSYGVGTDTLGNGRRTRWHSDNSIQVKYLDRPSRLLDKAAFSLTVDAGCESGGGVSCTGGSAARPAQYFLGWMLYNRLWFRNDTFGVTVGGGQITNPGRYLVLMPPINGATAASGTPYFTENPGDQFRAWDASLTFDYMPSQFVTFRWEFDHRAASVPYFAGVGGVTPPGGNQGSAGSLVQGWTPDLRKAESRINMALLVKL